MCMACEVVPEEPAEDNHSIHGSNLLDTDVVIGVIATRKERNTMEMSRVVPYVQDTEKHNSTSAKELKTPTHASTQTSCILYIGSVGIQIHSAESWKEDIKPNFRTPPCSCNLAGEIPTGVPLC